MKLSAMAEPKPEAASNAAKEQEETMRKEMAKKNYSASLVKVEGLCTDVSSAWFSTCRKIAFNGG